VPLRVFEEKRPLYQTVAEQLTAAIEEGRYAVGGMLPTEAELCAQFNVSRQTVREATRLLQQAGLVSRHQGVGTRVERATVAEHYVQRLAKPADILRYVKETRRKMLRVADVRAGQAIVALPGDPAARWRVLEALRFVADEKRAIAWTQIYVHPSYAAASEEKDRDAFPVYSLVERRFGIKAMTVRQEISAVAIRADVASHLHVKSGSPGLQIVRRYISTKDEEFEVAISIHPADRFQYTMQLDLAYSTGGGIALAPEEEGT
jgi:DNA-binding GntR family transcriptional regulator